jgi:16S rRNA (guanine966-N2)-methyltransferase
VRIIGGECRGRKLRPVPGRGVRPTADRIREAVFNILGPSVRDATVLDLFAGTGALGLEALSRGAAAAVFVDRMPDALRTISRNLADLGLADRGRVVRWDLSRNLGPLRNHRPPFDLVFCDPPYGKGWLGTVLPRLFRAGCLAEGARLAVEHPAEESPPEVPGGPRLSDRRRYGKTLVSFLDCDMGFGILETPSGGAPGEGNGP